MEKTLKRGRGRPRGKSPDAAIAVSIRLRPSEIAALDAQDERGWRSRVAELIAEAVADTEPTRRDG